MARKRDYAAEYARRQERARKLGFGSYYERRVAAVPKGQSRSAARGHSGYQDLLRHLKRNGEGALVGIDPSISTRDSEGRFTRIRIQVLSEGDEDERYFNFGAVTNKKIDELVKTINSSGGISAPNYPVMILKEG